MACVCVCACACVHVCCCFQFQAYHQNTMTYFLCWVRGKRSGQWKIRWHEGPQFKAYSWERSASQDWVWPSSTRTWPHFTAGTSQPHNQGGRDSSVVRVPDSWLKGHGFESLQERQENFLLQGWLSVLTLISVSVLLPCYCSSKWKIPVILPKVQVAGYS